ncbi:MAG: family 43 glycosylhydrolase, partial [Deltaproteobacteria bacterium]|nr:family 43 glycosylhydrolase [Deltaproteobacteria bacterium]
MSARRAAPLSALAGCALALAACAGELSETDPLADGGARDARASDASLDADGPTLDAGATDAATRDADPSSPDASTDAGDVDLGAPLDASDPRDAGPPPEPCTTRITYGSSWIHGPDHPAQHDDAPGVVTWDGTCVRDGSNSYATLSNGWRPYFEGPTSCILALDVRGDCSPAPAASCATRVTYGASWLRAPAHPADFDDVAGIVTWDGVCRGAAGGASSALLSNGWVPHFDGADACALSFRYEQCGGLFTNPVVPVDCPDPGVAFDGAQYVMACTGGGFALRTSRDLVSWTDAGQIFPPGARPSWASGDFWAPEIHRVGTQWVAYFSARNAADGSLALGAATAPAATGPFTDLGRPLLHDPSPGVIDAHHFEAPDGRHYLVWKIDGNAIGRATPIFISELADDGVTLVGARTEILVNDRTWEGDLVEGPWMIHEAGSYWLFYSANGYATSRYAVGVARASSPLGPFEKAAAPILVSNSTFAGPGHGSVVRGPRGDWVHVYHAWLAGRVGD